MEQQRILSLLVDNTSGVLSRVSGLFSRRGYNIDSLTVGTTADPAYSRMTVVCHGDELILEPNESVHRELMLIKVRANKEERQNLIMISDVFRAKIVDVGTESLIIELTGSKSKLEGFMELLEDYEILELARTGITGLSRGTHDVRYL